MFSVSGVDVESGAVVTTGVVCSSGVFPGASSLEEDTADVVWEAGAPEAAVETGRLFWEHPAINNSIITKSNQMVRFIDIMSPVRLFPPY